MNTEFSNWIKKTGLSRNEVADGLKVHPSTLWRWLSFRSTPRHHHIFAIVKYTDGAISLAALLSAPPPPRQAESHRKKNSKERRREALLLPDQRVLERRKKKSAQ